MQAHTLESHVVSADSQQLARKRIIQLFEILYWLLIFEGVLRKWIVPSLAKPLFFVRDPFVIYMYYLAIRHNLFPTRDLSVRLLGLTAVVFAMVGVLQVLFDHNAFTTAIYGLRVYFLYAPSAFLAGYLMTGADVKRIARRTMLVGIPMAALVFLQYVSPPSAPINKLPDGSDAFNYTGIARASGTFTFTQGHELFSHSLFCFLLATWLLPGRGRPLAGWLLLLATVACFLNVFLDGNRGVYLHVLATMLFSVVYRLGIMGLKPKLRTFLPEILCVVSVVAYVTFFSNSYEAMKERVEGHDDGPSRIQAVFTSMISSLGRTHLIGNGLGAGSQGGKALLANQKLVSHRAHSIDEEIEMGRIVEEAGPSGLLYIALRYFLAAAITVESFLASRRTRNPFPLILASFSVMMMITGQITFNGTCNGYCWVMFGLSIAANRLGRKDTRPDGSS